MKDSSLSANTLPKRHKTILGIILTAAAFALLPFFAFAQTGDFTVTGGSSPADWEFSAGVLTIKSGTPVTIANTTPSTPTTHCIVVQSGITASITLNGVNVRTNFTCAFDMTGATVYLTLAGTNTLESGLNSAGLQVPAGATLFISGTGALTAKGGQFGAGIGGG